MNDNYLITVVGTQTIDGESDSIEVIKAKATAIKDMYVDGTITLEELEEEKAKTEQINYAFNW